MGAYRSCCEAAGGGTRLRVRVVPRAQRTEAMGLQGTALKVRLKAPPVDGKANAALLAWLADVLGIRAADLEIASGQRSRDKVIAIPRLGPVVVADRLAERG